jgi:hypothetical protein
MAWRRVAAAWAGPLLITAIVLFTLRGFVFGDRLTNQQPDILSFWLPRWTFLGRSLAAGHLPLWNPFEMAGYRFAADPQSGWLYAAPSLLFSRWSPGVAMRAVIVLNPVLAGLGLYAFLRVDGLGRVAAAAGGLSLAGAMAASEIAVSLPFAGALAWTTIVLLGAAGFRRSVRWSSRLAWLALAAFGWSQVASAHLSHGLVIGSALVVAYLAANAVADVVRHDVRARAAVARTALFVVVLPLASLAVIAPRIAFIGDSSLGAGYDALGGGRGTVTGVEVRPILPAGVWAGWPLASSAAPGAYAGAVVLLAVPAAVRARRRRALVIAFGVALAGAYVVISNAVLGVDALRRAVSALPFGDVLLHNPGRLRYAAVLALPVLGAAGLQGLLEDPPTARATAAWLGAGAALWLALPLAAGGDPARWALFAVVLAPAAAAYWLARTRPRAAPVLVGVLALEIVAAGLLAGRWSGDDLRLGLEGGGVPLAFQPLRTPDIDLGAFLRPPPFVGTIGSERYLTWVPPDAAYQKGYLFAQDPWDWPMLANERGTLFEVRDVLGYNPVQLPRYWTWIRAANPLPVYYNATSIQRPTPADLALLGVRYLIVPQDVPSPVPGRIVQTADGYDLVRVPGAPLVSAPTDVRVVGSADDAVAATLTPGFDPSTEVILERSPGIATGGAGGSVTSTVPSAEQVDVRTALASDAVVLVRVAYDPGWTATVDGTQAQVLPADGFLLGVPVPAGEHTVTLTYHDAQVVDALWWSAAVWAALLLAWLIALVRERLAATEP